MWPQREVELRDQRAQLQAFQRIEIEQRRVGVDLIADGDVADAFLAHSAADTDAILGMREAGPMDGIVGLVHFDIGLPTGSIDAFVGEVVRGGEDFGGDGAEGGEDDQGGGEVAVGGGGEAVAAGEDVVAIDGEDAEVEAFRPLLEKSGATCGRLNESKMAFLFGSKARWVQSVALVPLGENGELGMMAIGSSDQARFYPGMGTLFLDLLAEVIAARLSLDAPEEQRRTA